MNTELITVTKDEMFEVIKAYQILTDFIQKHFSIQDIYTEDFLESMEIISKNKNEITKVNNFEDFVN